MKQEINARQQIIKFGRSLYQRGYCHGSSGNISVKLNDGILVTPTNSCLGDLRDDQISKVSWDGIHISGDAPSKEAFIHLLMYARRPQDKAVVHLHSSHSVAMSCCADIDHNNVLPPITAYSAMKVGRLPLVPYFMPGDKALAEAVAAKADDHHAILLANHGTVVSGSSLQNAVFISEELEETAKLFFILRGEKKVYLNAEQLQDLNNKFPS